ncbi:unnamed protein product [Brassica rapa subsp. trilocularis]
MGSPLFSGVFASTTPCQHTRALPKARKARALGAKNMYFLRASLTLNAMPNSKGSLRFSGLCSFILSHESGFETYVFISLFSFLFDNN